MGVTGSGSLSTASFGISGVEFYGSAIVVLVLYTVYAFVCVTIWIVPTYKFLSDESRLDLHNQILETKINFAVLSSLKGRIEPRTFDRK